MASLGTMNSSMPIASSSTLPIGHLESLRSKANQLIESMGALHQLLALDNPQLPYMPTWPDILAKYNLLLSQSHSFYASLAPAIGNVSASGASSSRQDSNTTSPYEKLALHPTQGLSDAQLDSDLVPLLRNQQTTDVLRAENETVRRIAESMTCRGSIGVLSSSQSNDAPTTVSRFARAKQPTTYQDVLTECAEIRNAHDKRAERAVRAVMMLRDKFEWKTRVEVEEEEPEELGWDPRLGLPPPGISAGVSEAMVVDGDDEDDEEGNAMEEAEGGSSEDEHMIEGALAVGMSSPGGLTPG